MVVENKRLRKLSDNFVTLEQKQENVLWNLIKDTLRAFYWFKSFL